MFSRVPSWLKLLLSLALTGGVLWALYARADLGAMARGLAGADPWWMAAYLGLMVPQWVIAGFRWRYMAREFGGVDISRGRGFSQVMGAYAANLLVPSKLGEFVKGFWLRTADRRFLPFFLVIVEKVYDVLATVALMTACLAVVLLAPEYQPRSVLGPVFAFLLVCWVVGFWLLAHMDLPLKLAARRVLKVDEAELRARWGEFMGRKGAVARVAVQSLVLWSVQLLQFWCMFRVFGVLVPLDELGAGSTLALFAGVLPVTVGGAGVRDGALLWYFGTGMTAEVVLSVGLLSLLRILLTGLAGVPFFFLNMRGGSGERE
jgi:uncharacterized protein (TIRG00374 family)